jgi:hypothetical protein
LKFQFKFWRILHLNTGWRNCFGFSLRSHATT